MSLFEEEYAKRLPTLRLIASELESELKSITKSLPRIDMIGTRVKDPEKFLEKVVRKNYQNPLVDIQDQVGARIVVFYKSDIEVVRDEVLKEFIASEDAFHEPREDNQFDYEGHHIICSIPIDIREKLVSPIEVFELQISTLFQHAWAQANHDLGYKPNDKSIERDTAKKIAWAAAQAWGADQIFDEIYQASR